MTFLFFPRGLSFTSQRKNFVSNIHYRRRQLCRRCRDGRPGQISFGGRRTRVDPWSSGIEIINIDLKRPSMPSVLQAFLLSRISILRASRAFLIEAKLKSEKPFPPCRFALTTQRLREMKKIRAMLLLIIGLRTSYYKLKKCSTWKH